MMVKEQNNADIPRYIGLKNIDNLNIISSTKGDRKPPKIITYNRELDAVKFLSPVFLSPTKNSITRIKKVVISNFSI